MDIVSIIVPVYNVEEYLSRCINSILNQSYPHLQVILVDDGSTDSSGKICDQFALKDERIHVIHKKNGGLSDARNAGLDIATGTYLTFVDSDDYIDLNYIQKLYYALVQSDCDISICAELRFTQKNDAISFFESPYRKIHFSKKMSAVDGLDCYLRQDLFDASSWGKMYKSALFSTVRFPKGMIHEDIGTTYKTFLLSQDIIFIPDKLYFYFQRQGSLLHSKKGSDSYWNGIKLAEQQREDICKYYPNLLNAANNRCFSMYCYVFLDNANNGDQQLIKYSWGKIQELRYTILFDRRSRGKAKCAALASFVGKKIFYLLGSK